MDIEATSQFSPDSLSDDEKSIKLRVHGNFRPSRTNRTALIIIIDPFATALFRKQLP